MGDARQYVRGDVTVRKRHVESPSAPSTSRFLLKTCYDEDGLKGLSWIERRETIKIIAATWDETSSNCVGRETRSDSETLTDVTKG